jgi:hypothetical protein
MGAGVEKFAQALGRLRNRIRPRHAESVKALRLRGGGQRRFERLRIGVQKSRLT